MRLWMFCLWLVSMPVAAAGSASSTGALNLQQAVNNVLEKNPQLKSSDYQTQAAQARVRAARLPTPLTANVEFENFAGSGQLSGVDRLESTLSLSKLLLLGDKVNLNSRVTQENVAVLESQQQIQRADLLAQTAKRFIDVVSAQQRYAIANDSVKFATQTMAIVRRRVEAGRAPDAELLRAQNTQIQKQLELNHAEHELKISRLKLVALWGDEQATFSTAQAELFEIEDVPEFAKLAQMLSSNPDLVRFATEQRLMQARIQLARAKQRADIEISAGLRHFNINDDVGLVLSFSMPFGSAERAKPSIEAEELLGQRQPFIYQQRRLELHQVLFEVYQEIEHAIEVTTVLNKSIIPNARRILQEYEKGYGLGRYSLLEYTGAQNSLLKSRLAAVTTAAKYHQYRAEIERLTGFRFNLSAPTP